MEVTYIPFCMYGGVWLEDGVRLPPANPKFALPLVALQFEKVKIEIVIPKCITGPDYAK